MDVVYSRKNSWNTNQWNHSQTILTVHFKLLRILQTSLIRISRIPGHQCFFFFLLPMCSQCKYKDPHQRIGERMHCFTIKQWVRVYTFFLSMISSFSCFYFVTALWDWWCQVRSILPKNNKMGNLIYFGLTSKMNGIWMAFFSQRSTGTIYQLKWGWNITSVISRKFFCPPYVKLICPTLSIILWGAPTTLSVYNHILGRQRGQWV